MIPLFKPYMPETPEIGQILKSGALAYGNYTKQFECRLKEFFGTDYLLVTSSFSDAISITLRTLNIEFGDEIIASPMACLASTQPLVSYGAKVVWADVDPDRGTLLPESVESVVTPNTKAIIHNHFCGYPGHIDEINSIGEKYNIPIIDDGIECFGSKYKNRIIGNCGSDVSVFSLTAVRFCNCIDGGVVIFKEKKLYEKALLVRDCGIERTKFRDEIGEISADCDIQIKGYSATMSNINGYIGLCQMDSIETLLQKHTQQAKKWIEFFSVQDRYKPISCGEGVPNYWVFGLLTDNKRQAIMEFRERGYYASGVHIRNDIYSVFGTAQIDLPGVDKFYNSFVALPCGWWMTEEGVRMVLV